MLDQIFQIIESAASSPQCALVISLALNVALAWGWWRREQGHSSRYDDLHIEWMERESTYMESFHEHDDDVAAIGKEAFASLQQVAVALAGMERTLDGVETLVHMAINNRLNEKSGDEMNGDDKNEN